MRLAFFIIGNRPTAHRERGRGVTLALCFFFLLQRCSDGRRRHISEVRPRKDRRGFDLISDALPFGGLWYAEPNAVSNAIGYAKFRSGSHSAVIRVYDSAGNVIETSEHAGQPKSQDAVGLPREQPGNPLRLP